MWFQAHSQQLTRMKPVEGLFVSAPRSRWACRCVDVRNRLYLVVPGFGEDGFAYDPATFIQRCQRAVRPLEYIRVTDRAPLGGQSCALGTFTVGGRLVGGTY